MATELQKNLVRGFLQQQSGILPQTTREQRRTTPVVSRAFGEAGGAIAGVSSFLGGVGRSIARNIGSAGVTIARALRGETTKELPTEDITQFRIENAPPIFQGMLRGIFGEEPIKSIEQRVAEAEPKVKAWGEALSKSSNPIYKEIGGTAVINPAALAFVGVMGSVGLDLTPFGGSSKNLFKEMVNTKTAGEAISLLSKMGVADDLARTFADDVVKVAKETDAKKLFESIANSQKATRQVVPEVSRVAPKLELTSSISKAKTYKIIKQEGIREVKGEPVKIVDGVDTFIHEGDGGWVVSEASTGRYLADSRTKEGAIAKAHFEISNVGEDKFKQLLSKHKLPQTDNIADSITQAKASGQSFDEWVKDWGFTKDFYKPEFALPGGNLKKVLQNRRSFNLGDVLSEQAPKQFQDIRSVPIEFVGDGIKIGNSKAFGTETLGMTTFENGRPVIYLSDRLAGNTKFNDVLGHEIEHALTAAKNPSFFSSAKSEISATANVSKRSELTRSQLKAEWDGVTKGVGEIPPGVPPIKAPVPSDLPEQAGNTIQKLIKAIDDAVPLRADQKKLYQEELARRTARVAQAGASVEGEAGFFAQLGALKGELPKKSFEAIRGQFNQKEVDLLFNTIEQTKTLLPLEKVGTKEGLRKLFNGVVPTPSEIEKLREVFPKELIDGLLARRPLLERMTELAGDVLNVPRTVMASVDLSAPFRQGLFMIGRPKRFFGAFKDMFKFAVSEKAYQGLIEGIKARPTYLKMKQGGLALTEIGGQLAKREEAFMGNIIERVPIFGDLVRASNRAYTGFLNKLRADIFDDILSKAKIIGRDIDDPLLKSMADFINAGTGRGKFGLKETGILPKGMERAATVMNAAFFSPRLMASRLNLLNPYFYVQLDPLVRKEAIKTLFATSGILGSVYGLWKLNGGDVGLDPRSADFGKMKIGNTRYDPLGGFQQYVKLAAQLITGEIISSTTGRTITLGEGFKPLTRKEIILRFFENKTSPIASFIIGLLTGQTATGEDVDVPTEVIGRFIPMVVQDMYDISQEEGAEGLLHGLPAIFGVGVQTYGKQELAEGKSRIGEPTTQIRPVPELAEKIRELVMGQIPLGSSKSYSIETYFDQLQNLPREEAAGVFDKIQETNPELAKKLSGVIKERELGITVQDKDLKAKGVASGDRALAIKNNLDALKTKEEKESLWDEYTKKGIITKEVARQLSNLLK